MVVSERLCRAWARLGYVPHDPPRTMPDAVGARLVRVASSLMERVGPGRVALVTGASGAGKTGLLAALSSMCRAAGQPVVRVPDAPWTMRCPDRLLIDAVPGSLEQALAALSRAGLSEARLLGVPVGSLSEGERARAGVARAIMRAERIGRVRAMPVWLIVDEFASVLDPVTASGLASSVRRWSCRTGHRVVCATARDELLGALAPDVLVWMELGGAATLRTRESDDGREVA